MNDEHDNAADDKAMLEKLQIAGKSVSIDFTVDSSNAEEAFAMVRDAARELAPDMCEMDGYVAVGDKGDERYWSCYQDAVATLVVFDAIGSRQGPKVCLEHLEEAGIDPEEDKWRHRKCVCGYYADDEDDLDQHILASMHLPGDHAEAH
jgi:hypothetical protein